MENLHSLDDQALLDMLMAYTAKYTQMIADHEMTSQEFYECKTMVKCLQEEIEAREKSTDKKSAKDKLGWFVATFLVIQDALFKI